MTKLDEFRPDVPSNGSHQSRTAPLTLVDQAAVMSFDVDLAGCPTQLEKTHCLAAKIMNDWQCDQEHFDDIVWIAKLGLALAGRLTAEKLASLSNRLALTS